MEQTRPITVFTDRCFCWPSTGKLGLQGVEEADTKGLSHVLRELAQEDHVCLPVSCLIEKTRTGEGKGRQVQGCKRVTEGSIRFQRVGKHEPGGAKVTVLALVLRPIVTGVNGPPKGQKTKVCWRSLPFPMSEKVGVGKVGLG